jgi:hypothetical protein
LLEILSHGFPQNVASLSERQSLPALRQATITDLS